MSAKRSRCAPHRRWWPPIACGSRERGASAARFSFRDERLEDAPFFVREVSGIGSSGGHSTAAPSRLGSRILLPQATSQTPSRPEHTGSGPLRAKPYDRFFSGLSGLRPCSADSGGPRQSLRHHDLETRGISNHPGSKGSRSPRCPHALGGWGSAARLALESACPQWLPFSVGQVPGCGRTCGAISLLILYCSILVFVLYIHIG